MVTRGLGYVLSAAGLAYVPDTLARGVLPYALRSMIGEGWLGLRLILTNQIEKGEGSCP